MVVKPHSARPRRNVPCYARRPRRLSALERVIERAEDRHDRREVRRQKQDPEEQPHIPLTEVERRLGL
jgi:hypothetical protein